MARSASGGGASPDMLAWQYRAVLSDLQELQRHAADPTCPCVMADLGEWCIPKHALGLATVALETAAMDPQHSALWGELGAAALDMHTQTKDALCQRTDMPDVVSWARTWRKKVEPVYYACGGGAQSPSHSPRQAPALAQGHGPHESSGAPAAEVALCPILCAVQGPKPRCTGAKKAGMGRCLREVKAELPGWCLSEKAWGETRGGETCYDPRAVCQESLGCRLGKGAAV